jgi:hypothetical protein
MPISGKPEIGSISPTRPASRLRVGNGEGAVAHPTAQLLAIHHSLRLSAPLTLRPNLPPDLPGLETRSLGLRQKRRSGGGVAMLTFGILGVAFGVLFFGSLFSGEA